METFSFLFSSPLGLLLTTLIIIGVLKFVSLVHRAYFYWKGKGVPYLPDSLRSLVMGWKVFLRRLSFTDNSLFVYNYFPDAKYCGMMEFATPVVLLRDPELIKDVLVKDFEIFHDHRIFMDESLDPLFSKNIFFLRGDRWREMRNTLSPSFTASKMKIMFDLVSKCSREFVNYLVDHPELYDAIETKQIFRRYTTDVIATTAFGISVNSMKNPNNEFYAKGIETSKAFSGFLALFKFMFMRAFPRFAKMFGMTGFSSKFIAEFFNRIVGETIKIRDEQGIVRPDMIHLLMQARDKDGPSVHKLTLDDIVSQAFIFFLAGFDTSSTLMSFVAHELAVNRDIQDRLREEVQQHVGENDEISYESLSKMIYMDMVINETLRKYPPAIFIDRFCNKSYELPPSQPGCKSLTVESGSIMMISVYGLHRDPKYFPDPDKFDPERFSEENKDNIVPYTYLPFGHGPRKCIGNRFALMETKILIAHLLQKFILKRTKKTVEPVVYDKNEFNSTSEGGFWIGLEKRET
ncbi:cytochrome P450 9e2-like isoform X3 [Cataglyphis hispanica]|uniref:cytochrome P450 9e2-like isoform X3 n=1 Tax=Cataglyphis hispanica TaxID=1086592 RepID=UPI00217FB08D|nr:cytochrome P450 9e2-like isoform X3 [Cataglyphis hispanica]XP_050460060.1 cytochrome P450 9e2-like isoform X3 [Cataglyphis hispanica]